MGFTEDTTHNAQRSAGCYGSSFYPKSIFAQKHDQTYKLYLLVDFPETVLLRLVFKQTKSLQ